ncbi:terminase large subunit domain-containing protein [Vandammella animalimorsus]|uniref:Terminase large subunit gp17-like C-terminal domain-containing protein n=1 Tax=Vandammella animalimorsus TaxID=2029117 RepID=A0A2A2A6J8_9BURK|nr:terminase family protein [Vandammella animalimorsus]PAT32877.1 hypothetical protein CK620_13465 [Vandammella animalimorsus]
MRKPKGKARIIPANPEGIFLPFQAAWIKDGARLKLMEKSRQIGLSWSTAYACVERTAAQGARHDQWVSSRDDLQARLFVEDCKLWAGIMQLAARDLGEVVLDDKARISAYVLEFANGRRIHSMSSNPDAQAGKRGGRVLDEFALHPDPRKLWSIAYPGITWGGNMELISTHRGSGNFFNELVREVKERGNPKNISLHTVTLQRALEDGFLYKLQERLSADDECQAMDEAEYFDFIRAGCADEESFQQEYMCNPADDNAAFLEYDLIASAEYAAGEPWQRALDEPVHGRLYAGLDIGRKKDLTVLWVVERLGDVLYTRHIETMQGMSKPQQEKVLWPWLERVDRVCIDYTGLGIGWGDDAQEKFGAHRVELITFTGQSKEALAYPVRGAMEDRKLRIPYDAHIRADLRSVTKVVTPTGNVRFTAERNADGHADRFWALALAVAAAAKPQGPVHITSRRKRDAANLLQGYW